MNKIVEAFKTIASTGARLSDKDRLRRVGEEGGHGEKPVAGIPGLDRATADLIVASAGRTKWETPEPVVSDEERRARTKVVWREDLEAEIVKTRTEIADLERRGRA